uniref:Uncharacterized protein n=1 Tax=Neisseria meningitidis alpha275 TaxID=295996 RepID=C6SGV2_NEIME|nr:hypothetical protein predicted by Glimmer/Critica [Neisseria meningitidis alpha275]
MGMWRAAEIINAADCHTSEIYKMMHRSNNIPL